ncbi:hypothetical protein TSAR_000929 [Trichomalopsis sarcophagae]|uniref:U4/U6.U5 small nuclear ribonucleoprotein 27 kDa protein n=1 Tax=Trichomalopsis sarcophagae TaxID=543379 RepID=A0A232ERB5_9HYME|nr:hypothetical protein TSAR_000929 [Trichomalopsis sarcophagae]
MIESVIGTEDLTADLDLETGKGLLDPKSNTQRDQLYQIMQIMINQADLQGKTPEEQQMMRIMGFCGFDTTKGKKVEGNDAGAVHVILKRKYRQYMNRKGGFNRPLDFVA